MLEEEALEHSPTPLNVGVEVANIEAPRTGVASISDEGKHTFLDEIPELPWADP
jgi:hypothetical protein